MENLIAQLKSYASRPGYRIVDDPASQTLFLLSHKNRAVGAVNYGTPGALPGEIYPPLAADSPREALDWYSASF